MAERGVPMDIDIDRLQLNLSNPRHEEVEDRDAAIIELLQTEQVLELARDIVDLGGINPMERLGVFPLEGTEEDEEPFYTAAEGNRRLCALVLLNDPEAVPAGMPNRQRYVRSFNQLSQRIEPIDDVPCVVFSNMEDARPWLERLHNGGRDGTGRRRWTPEQQARNTNDLTNRAATQLRDLAISLGMVTANQLSRTTTTQQRFISNSRFRQALGVVRLATGDLERTSCWHDFELMLRQFMTDIAEGRVNSRLHNNREQIEEYAVTLSDIDGLQRRNVIQGPLRQRPEEGGVAGEAGEGRDGRANGGAQGNNADRQGGDGNASDDEDDDEQGDADGNGGNNQARQARRNSIGIDDEIHAALHRLNNQKLTDLYRSLSTVKHPRHTLLAVVGCWSFLECMTRAHGRSERNDFVAYINGEVGRLGVAETPERRLRRMALEWIAQGGNITKHDWQGASYDTRQLFNAMDALKPIVVAMIDDIVDRPA